MKKTRRYIPIVLLLLITFSCAPPKMIEVEKSWAEQTLKELSLREKISQMMIHLMSLKFENVESKEWQQLLKTSETDGIGGIHIWFGEEGLSITMLNELQKRSKVPILIDMDIEKGIHQRFSGGTEIPPVMALAATGNPQNAFDAGKIIGKEGRSVGVHWNLMPVVDVNNNPKNPIINIRTFSDSPDMVGEYAAQYIKGLRAGGMLSTAKHFPGHGDTETDSHISLASIPSDSARLWDIELAPYKKVIAADVDAVMIAHLVAPDFQPNSKTPSTLSKFWIQDILRGELGFRGAIVTDAMEMGAITKNYSDEYALITAINVGNDIIIQNHDYRRSIDIVENAVKKGYIKQSRIDEAALQMLRLKEKAGLHLSKTSDFKTMQRNLGLAESHRTAEKIAQQALTLVRNDKNLIPLTVKDGEKIFVFDLHGRSNDHSRSDATKVLMKSGLPIMAFAVDESDNAQYLKSIVDQIPSDSKIIINAFVKPAAWKGTVYLTKEQTQFIKLLTQRSSRIIFVSYGNPYLIQDLLDIPVYMCAWDYHSILQIAGANALLGKTDITGKLPIDIPGIAERNSGIQVKATMAKPEINSVKSYARNNRLKQVMPYEVGADVKNVEILLQKAVADSAFPGGVLLAAKDGKIFIHESFGYHTYAKQNPTNRGDIFDMASITKVVSTTSAIMKLIDNGKINLNDPVGKFIPEFVCDKLDEIELRKSINIKQLLTHTAGLKPFDLFYKIEGSIEDRFSAIYKSELEGIPGEETVYSDIGFMLLGKIVERVTGKPVDEYVQQNIFKPLGMNSTYFNPPIERMKRIVSTEYCEIEGGFIRGHVHDENAYSLGGVAGHAGLFSTAGDIARFCQMMLNGGKYDMVNILDRNTIKQFTKRAEIVENSSRCLGWDSPSGASSGGVYLSDNSFGHSGFTGTTMWIDSVNNTFVILLTNAVHPQREWKSPKYYNWRQRIHSSVYESLGFTKTNPNLKWRRDWNE